MKRGAVQGRACPVASHVLRAHCARDGDGQWGVERDGMGWKGMGSNGIGRDTMGHAARLVMPPGPAARGSGAGGTSITGSRKKIIGGARRRLLFLFTRLKVANNWDLPESVGRFLWWVRDVQRAGGSEIQTRSSATLEQPPHAKMCWGAVRSGTAARPHLVVWQGRGI